MASEVDPLMAKGDPPLKWAAITASVFACLSGLLLGYDVGVVNGALEPIQKYFGLRDDELELFVGSLNACALPGCVLGGYLADMVGRRGSIAVGAVLFLVGNLAMTFATAYWVLLTGRAIAGVAVGMTLVTEPLYTAETAPARARGMMSTNVEVSFNIGILAGFGASWALGELPQEVGWRWMLGLCLPAPAISLMGVCCIIPESPRWLASKGRLKEAEVVLRRLLHEEEATHTFERLQRQLKEESADEEQELSWAAMFLSSQVRWLLFAGCGVAFFSQATGIESIQYYSSVILGEAGLSRDRMLATVFFLGCFKLAAILVQGMVVDVVGRRPLLIGSSLGLGLSMTILGVAFWQQLSILWKVLPLFLFMIFFSLGYGPIVYTLNAELYPKSCRSKALTLAMFTGRGASATVSLTFLFLAKLLTFGGAFLLYGCVGITAAVFVYYTLPETQGTALEDQDELCAKKC